MKAVNLKDARPSVQNPRSNFDLTFKRAYTCKFGDLFPIAVVPVMPGDEISISPEHLIRFAPFISQVYQNYFLSYDYYFVPNRLVWNAFDMYMNGKGSHVHPYFDFANFRNTYQLDQSVTTLFNAMDIPDNFIQNSGSSDAISAIPLAAYFRCILDYHIGTDTPLTDVLERIISNGDILVDGDNTVNLSTLSAKIVSGNPNIVLNSSSSMSQIFRLPKRLYPLDYFTHARSNPQLGPVMTIPVSLVSVDDGTQTFKLTGNSTSSATQALVATVTNGNTKLDVYPQGQATKKVTINGSIFQNTASIYDFYSAARLTELLALYGYSGFTPQDALAAEYGVQNSDSRLHKAEFLYHDTVEIPIGEVFSNNVNNIPEASTPRDIAGVGTAIAKANGSSRGFKHYFKEHGYIIGIASVYPEAAYCQGVPRHFFNQDRFDYPHPKLACIGMRPTLMREIWCGTSGTTYQDTFCYDSQYAEYKAGLNRMNGQLANTLLYLTAGRYLASKPTFNDEFLRVEPAYNGLNRTFNTDSDLPFDQPIFCDIKQSINAYRQLPRFGLFNIGEKDI